MMFVLIAALAATACIDTNTDRSEMNAAGTGQRGSEEPVAVTVEPATSQAAPYAKATGLAPSASISSITPATRGSARLSLTMPAEIQGKWRRSTGASVTRAQCVDAVSPNMGLILTIRPDGFSRFEEGGRLTRILERGPNRIRATFDTTYADTPTQGEFEFETQDNGQTLIERQFGDGAQPGILRYRRCPQTE